MLGVCPARRRYSFRWVSNFFGSPVCYRPLSSYPSFHPVHSVLYRPLLHPSACPFVLSRGVAPLKPCDACALLRALSAQYRGQHHKQGEVKKLVSLVETCIRQYVSIPQDASSTFRPPPPPGAVVARDTSLDVLNPFDSVKFIRFIFQRLADLKWKDGYGFMIRPYLTPSLPYLSLNDLAECIWAYAILQPDSSFGGGTTVSSGQGNLVWTVSIPNQIDQLIKVQVRCIHKWNRNIQKKTTSTKDTQHHLVRLLNPTHITKPNNYLVNGRPVVLDAVVLYRLVYGLVKLNQRTSIWQNILLDASVIVTHHLTQQLEDGGHRQTNLTATHLVRIAWSFAYFRVTSCNVLRPIANYILRHGLLSDLSYDELKVAKHVYEARDIDANEFLAEIDELLKDFRATFGPDRRASRPRNKGFKSKPKRTTITDVIC